MNCATTDYMVYENGGWVCKECEYPCETCLDADHCTSCRTGAGYLSNYDCIDPCPEGEWPDTANECAPCHASCLTCNGLTD
jgi:hypothetical protein